MKKIGIVGGIGPASTVDYYKGIVDGYRKRMGKGYPKMIIDSLDLDEMYDLVAQKEWVGFTGRLTDSIQTLATGGADVALMAANTAHIVFDEVQKLSPLPLLSIVDETCKYAQKKGAHSVIIFGTAFTMSSPLYTDAFSKYGMEVHVPSSEDQAAIHNIIFPNLQEGIVLPEEKEKILEIANRMIREKNADALVLGCTELPLIIKDDDLDVEVLDTTQIHIDAILDYILAE